MDLPMLVTYVKQSLLLVLLLSMPAVLTASLVGILVAFLQAITQVQDQSISFGIKLLSVIVAIAVTAAWLGGELLNFADQTFGAIAGIK